MRIQRYSKKKMNNEIADTRSCELSSVPDKCVGAIYKVRKCVLTESQVQAARHDLSITAKQDDLFGSEPKVAVLYEEDDEWLSVPRYYGIARFGQADLVTYVHGKARPHMNFNGSLDEKRRQPEAVAAILEHFASSSETPPGAIVQMPCGFGKTACAIYVACQLRVGAVVIVPNASVLQQQWVDRFSLFCPGANVMTLNGRQTEVNQQRLQAADVIVTTVQTLSQGCVHSGCFDTLGLCITDEAHSICAPIFQKAIRSIGASYRLSLTATPERQDNLHVGMPHMLGDMVFRAGHHHQTKPTVFLKHFHHKNLKEKSVSRNGKKRVLVSTMLNDLASHSLRSRELATVIEQLNSGGRIVLVLADRINLLTKLHDILVAAGVDVGLLIGKTKSEDRSVNISRKVLLASYGLCREGFDKPSLDTLVFATPITNIEQSVGRILRGQSSRAPVVVDFVDNYSVFFAYAAKRQSFYTARNYPVERLPNDASTL